MRDRIGLKVARREAHYDLVTPTPNSLVGRPAVESARALRDDDMLVRLIARQRRRCGFSVHRHEHGVRDGLGVMVYGGQNGGHYDLCALRLSPYWQSSSSNLASIGSGARSAARTMRVAKTPSASSTAFLV